jgi:hypothetical protein
MFVKIANTKFTKIRNVGLALIHADGQTWRRQQLMCFYEGAVREAELIL